MRRNQGVDREVLSVALDHKDAVRARLGLDLLLCPVMLAERRALTEPQHPAGRAVPPLTPVSK
jgi:hypothetical protein